MIFQKNDYKAFLAVYIASLPNRGRGFLTKFAHAIDMTPAQMSHVVSGEKDFTLEQAARAVNYLGLSELEVEYFMELVILARSGNQELRKLTQKKLEKLKSTSRKLQNNIVEHEVLSDADKATFYSTWLYSAIRMYCSLKPKSVEEICDYFHISRKHALELISFLISAGLLTQENARYRMGLKSTFVARESNFAIKHHANWRLRAIERSETIQEEELMYTSPVSMSKKDFDEFRAKLSELIKEFSKTVERSREEIVACLNVDFFFFKDPNS